MNLPFLFLNLVLLALGPALAGAGSLFKIYVEYDGVYRVDHADFNQPDLTLDSTRLLLNNRGQEVPIHVEDGGDGVFDSGDYFIFRGQHLAGDTSWFNEFSKYNVYRLRLDRKPGLRLKPAELVQLGNKSNAGTVYVTRHLEHENTRVTLPGAADQSKTESWYWKRLSHLDSRPFMHSPEERPIGIRIALTGMSQDQNATKSGLAQHKVDIGLDGRLVAEREWSGQESIVIEVEEPGTASAPVDGSQLEIKIPRRSAGNSSSSLIDVILLNWIELEFPFGGDLPLGRETVTATDSNRRIPSESLVLNGNSSVQLFSPSGAIFTLKGSPAQDLYLNENGRWHMVENHSYLSPSKVKPDSNAYLTRTDQQADYLVITHPTLSDAIKPLVEHHRKNGLNVLVTDVETIYNDFNHGIQSPEAIRDFIRYASQQWQAPAPRFVLLAGDAAWNVHDPGGAERNLVPSMRSGAQQEFAASDNGYAATDKETWKPQLAIGRLPAGNARELSLMVTKILAYQDQSSAGPWRRSIAWVTDRTTGFQEISNQLADSAISRGFAPIRVYPSDTDTSSDQDQAALRHAFSEGKLIVHFVGHGGRYVWRTGPTDYQNSTDLFSIRDLESLQAGHELPMVLSMTCSSGPFDHPQADSIAEAFLRLPDRGAVAVLAASWRIPASQKFSAALMDELLKPGMNIGEAVMRAKQKQSNRTLVESYNLLGDPALQLNLPGQDLELSLSEQDGYLRVSSKEQLLAFEGGHAIIDWLDVDGRTLQSEQITISGRRFEFRFDKETGQSPPAKAVVYAWHPASNKDGLGTVKIQ